MQIVFEVYDQIRDMIRIKMKDLNVLMYGSILNGLFEVNEKKTEHASDLDLTLINEIHLPRQDGYNLLDIKKLLEQKEVNGLTFQISRDVPIALIPCTFGRLLQFEVTHKGMKIKVEICENKLLEVLNSKLIRSYCLFDPRFR